MRIIRARKGDETALAEIGKNTFIETFASENRKEDIDAYVLQTFGSDQQLKEMIDPKRRIEIAWIDHQPVGFVHLIEETPDPSIIAPKPLEILRLYVDSRWHGKGVGQMLMDRALEIAKEGGFETLWLGVWERNLRAQAFYTKYGFKTVGSHLFQLGTDDQTDHIMVRSI